MRKILGHVFFARPATVVAPDLLGKFLVRRTPDGEAAHMITEAEAYEGHDDRASHASRGRTARNAVMFGPPGRWYVYFVYGMHEMLNVVTGADGCPSAVLLRGVEGIVGPGRLTKRLGISRTENTLPASKATGLWIEDRGVRIMMRQIEKTPRVGVAYAGEEWAAKPWRFVVKKVIP
jgi:DNA-3-methyladenine glycosylase